MKPVRLAGTSLWWQQSSEPSMLRVFILPVVASGGITTFEQAEKILERGGG